MFLYKPFIRMKARDIKFRTISFELSQETQKAYQEIKVYYARVVKSMKYAEGAVESAPLVLKDFLHFYLKCETFGLSLLNEIFKPHFVETMTHRRSVFSMLNKLMKIFMSVDMIRMRNPEIFCNYTQFKIIHGDEIYKICSELEDQKICVLSSIPLPMGRLLLSLFATDSFELYYPTVLSKRIRISLNGNAKKTLYLYARLMAINDYKYIHIYLGSVYRRFFGMGSYTFDSYINEQLGGYLTMLQQHD